MTKLEFLDALKKHISHLPHTEIEKSLSFYRESIEDRIEDGMSEAQAVADLGTVKTIAREIELENKSKKSHCKTPWMILAICGSPFWLPIALAFAVTGFALYVSIWAVIISLYAVLVSLAVAGVLGILKGIVLCIATNSITGCMIIGIAITSAGLFFLCVNPILWMTQKLIQFTVWIGQKIKRLFVFRKRCNQ